MAKVSKGSFTPTSSPRRGGNVDWKTLCETSLGKKMVRLRIVIDRYFPVAKNLLPTRDGEPGRIVVTLRRLYIDDSDRAVGDSGQYRIIARSSYYQLSCRVTTRKAKWPTDLDPVEEEKPYRPIGRMDGEEFRKWLSWRIRGHFLTIDDLLDLLHDTEPGTDSEWF